MSSGHGYKNKSTFPVTDAMTDGKPSQQHVEKDRPSADGTFVDNGLRRQSTHKPDLISNTTARLANPLGDLTEAEVQEQAAAFAAENNLPVDIFRKGGLLAKSPQKWDQIPDLTETERKALHTEVTHKYSQPFVLYNLVIACSVAAAVQGMDESVISGAQLSYPQQFGINPKDSQRNRWLEGLVNGAPYLCCGVIGCWLTDPLNKAFGRRGTIMITCSISFATCIWMACTNTWWHLFIARFFLGFGIGPKSATVPIFSAECVPANIRGSLVMQWQVWTAFGIVSGGLLAAAPANTRCSATPPTACSTTSPTSRGSRACTGASCSGPPASPR